MSTNHYLRYYSGQVGGGFRGIPYHQKGRGFFGKLASWALPFLKELFPVVGKQVLSSGVGLGQDLIEGQNIKMAAKKRLKEGSSKLLEKAAAKLQTGGRRRRRKRREKNLKLQKSKPSYHLKRRKPIKRRKKKNKSLNFL